MSNEAKLNAGEVSALETTVFIRAEMLKCSNYTPFYLYAAYKLMHNKQLGKILLHI
jgi:hypothetical protein